MVRLESERRCSIQVSGKVIRSPCKRCTSSATKELTIGGLVRAMSAVTRIRLLGSARATAAIRSAQDAARSRSIRAAAIRALTRRRFSMSARRNMMGIAHNSPSFKSVTVWYAVTKPSSTSGSTRPSPCEIASKAMSYTRGSPADGPLRRRGSSRL